jgi:hypothetical protein
LDANRRVSFAVRLTHKAAGKSGCLVFFFLGVIIIPIVFIYQMDSAKVITPDGGGFLTPEVRETYRNLKDGAPLTEAGAALYKLVYQGYLTPKQRGNIFREFNRVSAVPEGILERLDAASSPFGAPMCSMSVGDIVVDFGDDGYLMGATMCVSIGWQDITEEWTHYRHAARHRLA